uniref:NADH-ubiquinone oxidoreductase chain 6 n=1 Tax=Macrovipera schweizeri TaxID=110205 RepID=A0A5C2A5T2_9SAUR|nr:NADH dehydrogenase subunit 6 [Macrovipera schweizeri]QEO33834.1 NADH dehydrogenase subunit 6 [Macrovipera schweizeri]
MFFMDCTVYLVLVLVVFSVVVLSFTVIPYHGVVSLMGTSFLCCIVMVLIGRTYAALVMYIVYLGGLIVVFGYCVSVEKGGEMVKDGGGLWYFLVMVGAGLVVYVLMMVFGGVRGLLVYGNWEDWVSLEVNGCSVFYFQGGVGLVICAWGLVVALFSILVVLGWSSKGGVRPF